MSENISIHLVWEFKSFAHARIIKKIMLIRETPDEK